MNNSVSIPNYIRFQVFKRDKFTCQYCGKSGVELEVDHIQPVAKGGTNDIDNLITSCKDCNRAKSDDMDLYKGKLTVKEPKTRRVQLILSQSVYDAGSDMAWKNRQSFNAYISDLIIRDVYQNSDD